MYAIQRTLRGPLSAHIEVVNKCNLDCKMCQRKYIGVDETLMPFDTFKKIIDRLGCSKTIRSIGIGGWGEPFVHPDIFKINEYAKSKGYSVGLTSNGTLLSSEISRKIINSELNSITFSVDAFEDGEENIGHPNPKYVLNNIKLFKKLANSKNVRINTAILLTLYKQKLEDVFKLIKFAADAGIDSFGISRMDVRFQDFDRYSEDEELKIFKECYDYGKNLGIKVVSSSNLTRYKFINRLFDRLLCPMVLSQLYISRDGNVSPCCSLPRLKMGNIFTEDLEHIWNGKKFKAFRKNQKKICGKCDIMYYKQVK
jgi:MoaA/NifB/PqqE/SkfB family radical SAM enzyme